MGVEEKVAKIKLNPIFSSCDHLDNKIIKQESGKIIDYISIKDLKQFSLNDINYVVVLYDHLSYKIDERKALSNVFLNVLYQYKGINQYFLINYNLGLDDKIIYPLEKDLFYDDINSTLKNIKKRGKSLIDVEMYLSRINDTMSIILKSDISKNIELEINSSLINERRKTYIKNIEYDFFHFHNPEEYISYMFDKANIIFRNDMHNDFRDFLEKVYDNIETFNLKDSKIVFEKVIKDIEIYNN
jgi:hypothetical protein